MALSRSGLIWCGDERRSGVLLADAHPLNAPETVEFIRDLTAATVPFDRRFRLEVTFLKAPPELTPGDVSVDGGVRVVDIEVLAVEPDPTAPLRRVIFLDREGDFSPYRLTITHPTLDPERSEVRFSFKAGCPSPFDCRVEPDCPPPDLSGPDLDYMAKDYQSFRQMLFDLLAERNPGWRERSPADLGVALIELIAYVGDYLSYYQDAAAAEGYFDLCRSPVSARRHGVLVDYAAHSGRSAATFVHFEAADGPDAVVPTGAQLSTRIGAPLRGETTPPGPVLPGAADFNGDPALAGAVVFETAARTRVRVRHNALRIHSWGDADCCLARGAREAYLYAVEADGGLVPPDLRAGDYLLFEEVVSPRTGLAADADPNHRQVVRLVDAESATDPVYTDALTDGALTPRAGEAADDPSLPLQRVTWREADSLGFALCISAETPETGPIAPVSLARGNIAPCDHGRTVRRALGPPDPGAPRWPQPVFELPDGPLTFQVPPERPLYADDGRQLHERHALSADPRAATPAAALLVSFESGEDELWTPATRLLDAGPFDQLFVAEVEADGRARLRCGDDVHGRRPLTATGAEAVYRIGVGAAGALGAGGLVHVVAPPPDWQIDPADPGAPLPPFPEIRAVRQPLPALYGVDAETVAEVRQFAPEAFRAVLERAVTEADWTAVARRLDGVAAAHAVIRWIGSWYCVFVAIHPRDPADLRRLPGGGVALTDGFARDLRARLSRYKIAGIDMKVLAAVYVPLEIDIEICVAPGHFRGDVLKAVADRLSTRAFAGGEVGFFHRLNFDFGQPLYLSALYAALEAIDGVSSARVTKLKRYWELDDPAPLDRGVIAPGPGQILRLDNDPSAPEWGVLQLEAVGGL